MWNRIENEDRGIWQRKDVTLESTVAQEVWKKEHLSPWKQNNATPLSVNIRERGRGEERKGREEERGGEERRGKGEKKREREMEEKRQAKEKVLASSKKQLYNAKAHRLT